MTEEQISVGFNILRTAGYGLARLAFNLMKQEKDYDNDEIKTDSAILNLSYLRSGTNSDLAQNLLSAWQTRKSGSIKFGRVVACILAKEYKNEMKAGDEEKSKDFYDFSLNRAEAWMKRA